MEVKLGLGAPAPHILYPGSRQPPPGPPAAHPPPTSRITARGERLGLAKSDGHDGSPYKTPISPPMASRAGAGGYPAYPPSGDTHGRYIQPPPIQQQPPFVAYPRDQSHYVRNTDRPMMLPHGPRRPTIMGNYGPYSRAEAEMLWPYTHSHPRTDMMSIVPGNPLAISTTIDSSKRMKLSQQMKPPCLSSPKEKQVSPNFLQFLSMTMDDYNEHHTGFQFGNFARNEKLAAKGFPMPRARKTGTTIAGIVFKDGVVLGADTRATEGDTVADKNCSKIHYLQPNMYCCGAGTAADLEMTTALMASQLELHRLNTNRQVPVVAANRMLKQMLFRYQGHIGAALVLGGVDKNGFHIYSIHPHGSTDRLPYTTMGSGSLAAMSVFEARWKPDMELEEAKQLVRDAIAGGVFNDLGSGSNIDLCVITKDGANMIRPYDVANIKGERLGKYEYKRGTTDATKIVRPIIVESQSVKMVKVEEMDTA